MKKIKCKCGMDITTMENCTRDHRTYTCKYCRKDISRKKLEQLVNSLIEAINE